MNDEVAQAIHQWCPPEPPSGPLCVSPIYHDPRLVDLGLRRGRCLRDYGCQQLLVWLTDHTKKYPDISNDTNTVVTFDMSGLQKSPRIYGMPQGLIYLLGQRLWERWERPFGLCDVDIAFSRDWLRTLSRVGDSNLGLVCGEKAEVTHALYSGISYVRGPFEPVAKKLRGRMTEADQLPKFWEERLLKNCADQGLLEIHTETSQIHNVDWRAALNGPNFSWDRVFARWT